jgi:hypothetical protein
MEDSSKFYRFTLLIIDGTGRLHSESEFLELPEMPVTGNGTFEFIGAETVVSFAEEISQEQFMIREARN